MSVREDSSSVAGLTVGIPAGSLVKLIPQWRWAIVLISYAASMEGKRKTAMIELGAGLRRASGSPLHSCKLRQRMSAAR